MVGSFFRESWCVSTLVFSMHCVFVMKAEPCNNSLEAILSLVGCFWALVYQRRPKYCLKFRFWGRGWSLGTRPCRSRRSCGRWTQPVTTIIVRDLLLKVCNSFKAFLRKFLKNWSCVIVVKFGPKYGHNFFVQGVYIAKMGGNCSAGIAGPAKHEIV